MGPMTIAVVGAPNCTEARLLRPAIDHKVRNIVHLIYQSARVRENRSAISYDSAPGGFVVPNAVISRYLGGLQTARSLLLMQLE
jgi:hypothetical protein